MSAPPKKVTDLVDVRDGFRCVRCGISLAVSAGSRHHRMRRRDGGHSVAQLILLCGSGTTGCHGYVHAYPANARANGWILPALRKPPLDPCEVPVLYVDGWHLLTEEGLRVRVPESRAIELMEEMGLAA